MSSPREPARIPGIDAARGLALIGMVMAHTLVVLSGGDRLVEPADPATWVNVVNSRSSVLFVTLAGCSLGLMSGTRGGARPLGADALRRARLRILVRALAVFALGVALTGLDTAIEVILETYGVLFVVGAAVAGLRARTLWTLAIVSGIVTPPLAAAIAEWATVEGLGVREPAPLLELLVTGSYAAMPWSTFVFAGLALVRSDLGRPRTLIRVGAWAGGVGVAVGALAVVWRHSLEERAFGDEGFVVGVLRRVLIAAPHTSSWWEVLGSGSFALAVICGCVLVCRDVGAARLVTPLRGAGRMPLTLYVTHIVCWRLIVRPTAESATLSESALAADLTAVLLVTLGVMAALPPLWFAHARRGPLEGLLHALTVAIVPPRSPCG